MVLDGLIIGLIIGFFKGGTIRNLAKVEIKYSFLFILLAAIQIFFILFQGSSSLLYELSNYYFVFMMFITCLLVWINKDNIPGSSLIIIGGLLNVIVMLVNGGRMPVSLEAAKVLEPEYIEILKSGVAYGKHVLMTEDSPLKFLGDIIALHEPYPKTQVISVGDIVINIGAFFATFRLMQGDIKKGN